jgi:hypothetical protein
MKDAQKDQTDTEEIDIRKLLTLCNDFFQLAKHEAEGNSSAGRIN